MFEDWEEPQEEEVERPRDPVIDEAKSVLMEKFFQPDTTRVYYGRQLEVLVERNFFHWITKKALNELAQEGQISGDHIGTDTFVAHLYWPKRHRYPRRQMGEILELINAFSDNTFTRALGLTGETLLDASMARIGFRVLDQNVRAWEGRDWTATAHNLDRLVARDGILYGVEVKNTLGYIEREELRIKIEICRTLGAIPLFIFRSAPKTYIHRINLAGGFALLHADQFYPLMAEELAKRVRDTLTLPVRVVSQWPATSLDRFEKWHVRQVEKARLV